MAPEAAALGTLEDIITTDDIEYAPINVWGRTYRLRSVSADAIIRWSELNEGSEEKRTMGLRLITESLVDADGKLLMDKSHVAVLRKKSHKETEKIVKAILKLNGMNVKAEADAKND